MPVTIYTSQGCMGCNVAKQLLKKYDIAYEEMSVHTLSTAKLNLLTDDRAEVPIILINGKVLCGFNRDELMAEIKLYKGED